MFKCEMFFFLLVRRAKIPEASIIHKVFMQITVFGQYYYLGGTGLTQMSPVWPPEKLTW